MTIRGEQWFWSYGRDVRIVAPDGTRHAIALTTFSGMDWNSLERAAWKKPAFSVTPRKIRRWIDRRILGYTDADGMPPASIPSGWRPVIGETHRIVAGPRGPWRWRLEQPDVEIVSPEEVSSRHRAYQVTGQGVEAFFAAQLEDMIARGIDPYVRGEDRADRITTHPMPFSSRPTDADVRRFIVESIVGGTIVE